jgi:transposase
MRETARHHRAFETYYALGVGRTLPAVAEKLGVSVATVKRWSAAFSWQGRVLERDEAVAGIVERKATRAEVDRRTRNRQLVQAALITATWQITEGKVRATLGDLDRLIRLESFLEGEPDSRQEVIERDLRGKSTEELRAMVRSELRELAALTGVEDAEFELEERPKPPAKAPPADETG